MIEILGDFSFQVRFDPPSKAKIREVVIYLRSSGKISSSEQFYIAQGFFEKINQELPNFCKYNLKYRKERSDLNDIENPRLYFVKGIYVDNCSLKQQRVALSKLLEDFEKGTILYCHSPRILTKNHKEAEHISKIIETKKGKILTFEVKTDSIDKFILEIGNYEKKERYEKVGEKIKNLYKEGKFITRVPFGWKKIYVNDEIKLVKDENEQLIITYILKIKKNNPDASLRELCRIIDREGIKIRGCKKCYPSTLKRICNDIE